MSVAEKREARGAVAAMRREQLLDALAAVVVERGLRKTTVAAVAKRAALSRAVFDDLFASLDACFLALVDRTLERAVRSIEDSVVPAASWEENAIAGVVALLEFLDSEPLAARACLLKSLSAPAAALRPRIALLERLRVLVDRGRAQLSDERQPPAVTAEATIASMQGILRQRLSEERVPPFADSTGELVEMVVSPYRGPSAARRAAERSRELVRVRTGEEAGEVSPVRVEIPRMLCHASARRMRSALLCILECPGASNGDVAAEVGIAHPGQASALLGRLHEAGLLEKRRGGGGQPNAWSLSPYGAEVARALAGS